MEPVITKHIECQESVCGGKPCVAGTRIRVQDIYVWHELQAKTPDEIVSTFPQLTLSDVHAALAYFWDNREEIQKQMTESEEFVESLKNKFPSKLQVKMLKTDAGGDTVSSG